MARGMPGALPLAGAVPGTGHTEKAVPGAAAVPRGGKAEHPDPRFNSVLCRAEELFSVFLRFTLCLFLSLFFLFNCLSTRLAPSHATVLPAAFEGNEVFAAVYQKIPTACPVLPVLWLPQEYRLREHLRLSLAGKIY